MNSFQITTRFAWVQLKRLLRDPVTTLVLFGIPVILVLIFGSITKGADSISIRVAVVNNSQTELARQMEKTFKDVDAFKLPDKQLSLDEAKQEMKSDAIDSIIELSDGFGAAENGVPRGEVKVYSDQTDTQTGGIVSSIVQSVITPVNEAITQSTAPLKVARASLSTNQATAFDNIYAVFTGMSIMMVGVFAVASTFPADKKSGALRRLHVTPIRAREVIAGTMMSYMVIGALGVALLTAIALFLFDFNMRGDWLNFSVFVSASLVMMLGFGLAIGGFAKNTTQSDIIGQIVFISSLAVSGVWFPRALLPEWAQGITSFLPLTPVIDGIREITTESASLISLAPELAVIGVWTIVVYVLGVRLFKWE